MLESSPYSIHFASGPTNGAAKATGQVVRITDPSGNIVATVEPQTAQQALEYLRRRVGDGTLEYRNGTGLAPFTPLTPGIDYVFRPATQPASPPPAPVSPPAGVNARLLPCGFNTFAGLIGSLFLVLVVPEVALQSKNKNTRTKAHPFQSAAAKPRRVMMTLLECLVDKRDIAFLNAGCRCSRLGLFASHPVSRTFFYILA